MKRPSLLDPLALSAAAAVLAFSVVLAPPATSQVVVQQGPKDGFVLLELGIVLVPDPAGDAARVEHAFDAAQRPAAYRDVDVAAGDRVLAINGRRVRSAKELEAAFTAVPVGEAVELGVERQRDGEPQRRIVKLTKADPASLPRPQLMRVHIEPDPDADVDGMPALGAVMRQKHAKGSPVEVAAVLPNGNATFREGDRLVALDGKPVLDLADFGRRWDAIAVGAKVTLVLENGGKRRTETFARREAPTGQRTIQH